MTGIEIGAIAAAVGIAKNLKDLAASQGTSVPPDMRDQIVALFDRVMDVQTEVLTAQHRELKLTERCRKLEDDLRSVRDWQAEKARYTLTSLGGKTFVYAVKPDDPRGEPPRWLCVRCIEDGKKSVLQHWGVIYSNRRWKWPPCEAIISAAQELAPDPWSAIARRRLATPPAPPASAIAVVVQEQPPRPTAAVAA